MPVPPDTVNLQNSDAQGAPIMLDSVDVPMDSNVTPQPLPLENELPEENPLPAANPLPGLDSTSDKIDLGEEEGIIETLDSAANKGPATMPEKDENSILDTAGLFNDDIFEGRVPTRVGQSVFDANPKMLTLTARPAESHQVFVPADRKTIPLKQHRLRTNDNTAN